MRSRRIISLSIILSIGACGRGRENVDSVQAGRIANAPLDSKEKTMSAPVMGSTAGLWEHVYVCGPGSGYSQAVIRHTRDGGYIVVGDTCVSGSDDSDILVLKLGADGAIQWQKSFGGIYRESASSVGQTDDAGFIVAGSSRSFRTEMGDVWVMKLDAEGKVVWQKTYGGAGVDEASSIRQTKDGGCIVAGRTSSFGVEENDFWIIKLDASGGIVWQKSLGRDRNEYAFAIEQTADGGYIAAGTIEVVTRFVVTDAWVVKLNAEGDAIWQKSYGLEDNDGFSSIGQTADGGYIAAGYTVHGTSSDVWVVRLGSKGEVVWQKSYGGDGGACEVLRTDEGGFIVAGKTEEFGAGDDDAWILKLDGDGEVSWQKSFGGTGSDRATSVDRTGDGCYAVAGYTRSFGIEGENIWVVKLAGSGEYDGSGLLAETFARARGTTASFWNPEIRPKTTDAVAAVTDDAGTETDAFPKEHDAAGIK